MCTQILSISLPVVKAGNMFDLLGKNKVCLDSHGWESNGRALAHVRDEQPTCAKGAIFVVGFQGGCEKDVENMAR